MVLHECLSLCIWAGALAGAECSAAVVPLGVPAMSVKVTAGSSRVQGKIVTVAETVGLPIDLPERVLVRGEEVKIGDEAPAAWHKGTILRATLGTVDTFTRVPLMIDSDSVIVRSLSDPPGFYIRDKDYLLDPIWAGLCRREGGAIPKDATVLVDYAVYRQRIDLIQVSQSGAAAVKRGQPAVVCPAAPAPDPGWVSIAHIHVPFRANAIADQNIYSLPSDNETWRDHVRVSGRKYLKRTLRLLREGKPLTVVCWGDSVTAGGSASAPEKRYVDLFGANLRSAYPEAKVGMINAGIGGSNTDSRRAGFETEVLAHRPDLITVEFINDWGFPPDKIRRNFKEFMTRAREKLPEVEFIIITPHFVRPDWIGPFDAAVAAMRGAASENRAAVADAANVWANLRRVGIPYTTLLANEINHPNDLGHEFFAACLMRLLAPDAR